MTAYDRMQHLVVPYWAEYVTISACGSIDAWASKPIFDETAGNFKDFGQHKNLYFPPHPLVRDDSQIGLYRVHSREVNLYFNQCKFIEEFTK
jgi:hypothetical protein